MYTIKRDYVEILEIYIKICIYTNMIIFVLRIYLGNREFHQKSNAYFAQSYDVK